MRAQFEIMGLAVAVIIISVGVFLLLMFGLRQPDPDTTEIFINEQYNQNVLDALMKTSLKGCRGEVRDLIEWNVTGAYPPNPPSSSACALGTRGVEVVLHSLLDQALRTYNGQPYWFEVRRQPCSASTGGSPKCDMAFEPFNGGCDTVSGNTRRAGKHQIALYPYSNKPAEAVLWICDPRSI